MLVVTVSLGAVFLDGGLEVVRKIGEKLELFSDETVETVSHSKEHILERLMKECPKSKLEELCGEIIKGATTKPLELDDEFYKLILEKIINHYDLPAVQFFNQVMLKIRSFIKKNRRWVLIQSTSGDLA